MPRYAARPRAWVSATDEPETLPTCVVIEADDEPVFIGLYDADGDPLYRFSERIPLGFCRE
jgi:hypothetical protein